MHSSQYTVLSSKYTVHSTQFYVHNTQFTVHCSQFKIHSSQYSSQFKINSSQYTVFSSQHTVHNTQFSVHNTQFTVHSFQFTAHTPQYTVFSSQYTVSHLLTPQHTASLSPFPSAPQLSNVPADTAFLLRHSRRVRGNDKWNTSLRSWLTLSSTCSLCPVTLKSQIFTKLTGKIPNLFSISGPVQVTLSSVS